MLLTVLSALSVRARSDTLRSENAVPSSAVASPPAIWRATGQLPSTLRKPTRPSSPSRPNVRNATAEGQLECDRRAQLFRRQTIATKQEERALPATGGGRRPEHTKRSGLCLRRAEAAGRSIRWRPSARPLATEAEGEAGARAHRDGGGGPEGPPLVEDPPDSAGHRLG